MRARGANGGQDDDRGRRTGLGSVAAALCAEFADEGVFLALGADGGGGAVAREDLDVVAEGEELGLDAGEEEIAVATGEVPSADAACEENVATEDEAVGF